MLWKIIKLYFNCLKVGFDGGEHIIKSSAILCEAHDVVLWVCAIAFTFEGMVDA